MRGNRVITKFISFSFGIIIIIFVYSMWIVYLSIIDVNKIDINRNISIE